jgi:hypothetical protein
MFLSAAMATGFAGVATTAGAAEPTAAERMNVQSSTTSAPREKLNHDLDTLLGFFADNGACG